MFTVLVVEDDLKLLELFSIVLEKNGYKTLRATNGEVALGILDTTYVDLIISDLMMPHMDGFELLSQIRSVNKETPMIIITAKEQFKDKEQAFHNGADDYMIKPINVNEMLLRVKAILRRSQIIHDRQLTIGSSTLLFDTFTVEWSNISLLLPQKEFLLLYKLTSNTNRTYTRQQLFDEIWGIDSDTDIRTIDVHINRLRDHISDNPDFKVTTIRGLGYKLEVKSV
ncbi:MAG: response regulator transcription factor [Vallitaleaceae bacterium]|jgi:two-component system OmpR family response regulator|nr:response regulator transcription factor [Vallitaleaceae bacterium]